MNIQLSPSLMCMNLANFASDLEFLDSRVESYHIDIMDGHYVKNITLSPWFIEQVKSISKAKISTHFMVEHPEEFIIPCIEAGSDMICIHTDRLEKQAFRLINIIKDQGCKVGVVLNPATPLFVLDHYIHLIEKITVMTVDPGFAGQKFVVEAIQNIKDLVKIKKENNYHYQIEVDGSCNEKTWATLYEAGTEVFIVGSSGLFGLDSNLSLAWDKMQKIIEKSIR